MKTKLFFLLLKSTFGVLARYPINEIKMRFDKCLNSGGGGGGNTIIFHLQLSSKLKQRFQFFFLSRGL